MAQKGIVPGIVTEFINSDIADGAASESYSIPFTKQGINLAWSMVYTGSPSVVAFNLQISMDNSNWVTIDSTSDTTGCYRIVSGIVAKFIRLTCTTFTTAGAGNALGTVLVA